MPTSYTCSESSVKKRQENKVENCQWTVPFIISCSQKQKKKSNRCKTSEYPLLSWPCGSLLLFGTPISLLFTEKMKKLFSTYCVLRFQLSPLPSSHISNTQCPTSPICSAGIFVMIFWGEKIFHTLPLCTGWLILVHYERRSLSSTVYDSCPLPLIQLKKNWTQWASHSAIATRVPSLMPL